MSEKTGYAVRGVFECQRRLRRLQGINNMFQKLFALAHVPTFSYFLVFKLGYVAAR